MNVLIRPSFHPLHTLFYTLKLTLILRSTASFDLESIEDKPGSVLPAMQTAFRSHCLKYSVNYRTHWCSVYTDTVAVGIHPIPLFPDIVAQSRYLRNIRLLHQLDRANGAERSLNIANKFVRFSFNQNLFDSISISPPRFCGAGFFSVSCWVDLSLVSTGSGFGFGLARFTINVEKWHDIRMIDSTFSLVTFLQKSLWIDRIDSSK